MVHDQQHPQTRSAESREERGKHHGEERGDVRDVQRTIHPQETRTAKMQILSEDLKIRLEKEGSS